MPSLFLTPADCGHWLCKNDCRPFQAGPGYRPATDPSREWNQANIPRSDRASAVTIDWPGLTECAAMTARKSGALVPTDTDVEIVTEAGLAFEVRVARNLERKRRATSKAVDPFAPPYDPHLLVGEIPPAHMGLLNKFPVLDRHLLIVTRASEPQTDLLTPADCEAVLHLLRGWDGLVYYNGGPEAGASQPHKHLQMIDLPHVSTGAGLSVIEALAADDSDDAIGQSSALPFPHARARLPASAWSDPAAGAAILHELYLGLLAAAGLPASGPRQPGPYNLLATRDWLWLVPRRCASHEGIAVNALGFAGALLVVGAERLARLKSIGPCACLRGVCR